MDKLPDALEILADSECHVNLKVIGNRQSKNPLEFKVARHYSKYIVGPAHDDHVITCFYPDLYSRDLDMRHKILKTLFRIDGQLELTLLNTENEVTVPWEPSFIFYNKTGDMPEDAEYVIVNHKHFLDRRYEIHGYKRKEKDK
ncbi:hypothetical protein HON71_02145 [Candidatus Woesearchaeota archaeon]|jgi:hypothetical protein|nr:hypothetical protein [Candidatus Woesearchaeota archaeon]MBT5342581.1 hypothetical protein [Candidatus Woesearchaeota archaeon]